VRHTEKHKTQHIGWLRAALLGANDGLISTASLILGVIAADTTANTILIAGSAGLVAGAMSMAAGEYVSVSSQSDVEKADLERERQELKTQPLHERAELAAIYIERGLDPKTASEVATQLMAHDALAAHARDELGISDYSTARPIQAALASACSFTVGAIIPLLMILIVPLSMLMWTITFSSLICLALLGALSAYIGGASLLTAAARVMFWGALAMALTTLIGSLFGVVAT
jgi:vacuolar iron transporter family protein